MFMPDGTIHARIDHEPTKREIRTAEAAFNGKLVRVTHKGHIYTIVMRPKEEPPIEPSPLVRSPAMQNVSQIFSRSISDSDEGSS